MSKDNVQTQDGHTPKTCVDCRDLLRPPDIDAVITTPEHLHYEMALAALGAGGPEGELRAC